MHLVVSYRGEAPKFSFFCRTRALDCAVRKLRHHVRQAGTPPIRVVRYRRRYIRNNKASQEAHFVPFRLATLNQATPVRLLCHALLSEPSPGVDQWAMAAAVLDNDERPPKKHEQGSNTLETRQGQLRSTPIALRIYRALPLNVPGHDLRRGTAFPALGSSHSTRLVRVELQPHRLCKALPETVDRLRIPQEPCKENQHFEGGRGRRRGVGWMGWSFEGVMSHNRKLESSI